MAAVTLTGVEQGLGALVLFGAAFAVIVFVGGYTWYRLVSYPLARRAARELGYVVVGANLFGDSLLIEWAETDWRAATFREWRTVKTAEDEELPRLWPTRQFRDDEVVA